MIDVPQAFGKYALHERIAIGGMAEIFRATAPGLGGFEKVLAIKRLHPRYSEDQDFIRMLVDEAKIAVCLSHANIGQIFDLSREGELVYIAMEYIDGRDLYRVLRKTAELDVYLPIEVAVFIAMELCAGLDYAHRKTDPQGNPLRIIHRDISPQNVLVSWEGEVKIVDFGIAKAAMRAIETESGVIKGKFYYMSPEQARGDKLDHRTDIFSAGIVLYEMLTGVTLYREEDDVTLLSRVRRAEIDPPTQLRGDIPLELERIVMKALARDPRRRYQTAHHFRASLESFLFSLGQPFSRPQLGAFLRELFQHNASPQGHSSAEAERRDQFMSQIDYVAEGSKMEGLLSGVVTALGPSPKLSPPAADEVRIALKQKPDGTFAHDPMAEVVLIEDGEDFEEEATRAGSDALPKAANYQGDEAATNFFQAILEVGEEDEETLAMPRKEALALRKKVEASLPPTLPRAPAPDELVLDDLPATRGLAVPQPPPRAPDRLTNSVGLVLKKRTHELPKLKEGERHPDDPEKQDAGMVTGVYNEPTKVTDLRVPPKARGAAPAPIPEITDIPLSHKFLFALGLSIILLLGGTISALASVFIERNARDNQTEVLTPKFAASAPAASPKTRAFEVHVEGPKEATVTLSTRPPQPAPAAYDALDLDRSYELKVEAPGYQPHQDTLQLSANTVSPYTVRLSPRLGFLKVVSEPPGASVELDGAPSGATTPAMLRDLPQTEPHRVVLRLDGHQEATREVRWSEGTEDLLTLEVTLAKLTPLADATEPPKAGASAEPPKDERPPKDEKPKVQERPPVKQDPPKADARDKTPRDKEKDKAKPADTGGKGGYGYLSVNAKPWGSVHIDGRKVANSTPLIKHKLPAGYHSVRVVFPTLGGQSRTVNVQISKDKTVPLLLKP